MGIYPVPLPVGYSSLSSSCYIAAFGVAFLYSGSFWSSLYYGVSSLWVGLYKWLDKVSWEACVGILVGEARFLISGVQ